MEDSEKMLEVTEPTTTESEQSVEQNPNAQENNSSDDEVAESFEDSSKSISEQDSEENNNSSEKQEQSKEERSEYASIRRKAEKDADAKLQAERDKAYKEGMLAAFKGKINPFTNTEIKDMEDVEVYNDMYKLSEEGKDPVADYASYVANKKREEARIQKEEKERAEKADKEVQEFMKKYPNTDLTELLNDDMFRDYADGKDRSLIETYESYQKFQNSFRNKGIETAKKTIANGISSPGSLGAGAENKVSFATMSKEDFEKYLDKVKNGE